MATRPGATRREATRSSRPDTTKPFAVLSFSKTQRLALARLRSVKLKLRLTAVDAAGNVTVTTKTLKLRR